MNKFLTLLMLGALFSLEIFAMSAVPTRVYLWKKGETIGAEDFIAANEQIVDYLATLKRPTEPFKGIKYTCLVKSRAIQPTVQRYSGTNNEQEWVTVRMVYEMKDCVESP